MDPQLIHHSYVRQESPTIDECEANRTECNQPCQVHTINQKKKNNINVGALPKKSKQHDSSEQLLLKKMYEILNEPVQRNDNAYED